MSREVKVGGRKSCEEKLVPFFYLILDRDDIPIDIMG